MDCGTSRAFNAIILAAGFGTRLRPLTDHMPKALTPLCGVPLLENAMLNLDRGGCREFAVNAHYQSDEIFTYARQSEFCDRVSLFHEEEILGTGGGLINARELLCEYDDFMLHNVDIVCDLELNKLFNFHCRNNNLVTMCLLDGPENKVSLGGNGMINDILGKLGKAESGDRLLTYCGISVFNRRIFDFLPEKACNCSIINAILELMTQIPGRCGAYVAQDVYWNDIGTADKYFQAHEDAWAGRIKLPQFSNKHPQMPDCVLLPGGRIGPDDFCRELIVGKNFRVHRRQREIRQLEICRDLGEFSVSSLPFDGGGVRKYYRLKFSDKKPKILMISKPSDADFGRFCSLGDFFARHGLPVAQIYKVCADEHTVLLEDLGDLRLCELTAGKDEQQLFELYCRVLDKLHFFHSYGTRVMQRHHAPEIRIFDHDYLRWESDYFSERFLRDVAKVDPGIRETLIAEFESIAAMVDKHQKSLIHRDFQSHNIMCLGNEIYFVDFQGARLGSSAYDAVSLILDPYVKLSESLRQRLFAYWTDISGDGPQKIRAAALQRLMQALGAYSFLALQKGKKHYLKYIPPALKALRETLGYFELPELKNLLDSEFFGNVQSSAFLDEK